MKLAIFDSGMWVFTSSRHEAFYTNDFSEMKLYLLYVVGIPLESLHEAIQSMEMYKHNTAEFGLLNGLLLFTNKEEEVEARLARLNN